MHWQKWPKRRFKCAGDIVTLWNTCTLSTSEKQWFLEVTIYFVTLSSICYLYTVLYLQTSGWPWIVFVVSACNKMFLCVIKILRNKIKCSVGYLHVHAVLDVIYYIKL